MPEPSRRYQRKSLNQSKSLNQGDSMKKVFVFLIVILVLLGIGWTVYLKERNRRFVESLPKPLDSAREVSSPPVPVVSEKTEQGFDPEFSTEIPDQRGVSKPHSESGATAQIPLEPKTLQPERHSHEKHPEPELQEETPRNIKTFLKCLRRNSRSCLQISSEEKPKENT